MVQFRNIVYNETISNWWDNGGNQIAFSRGNKGFIAINNDDKNNFVHDFDTRMPEGKYCDIISGVIEKGQCNGTVITVHLGSIVNIRIPHNHLDSMWAIHEGTMLIKSVLY